MQATLEKVKEQQSLRQSEVDQAYRDLIADTWAGREVDPEKALATLEAANRTAADLETDCRLRDEREAAKQLAAQLPGLRDELARNSAALESAKAVFIAAERAFLDKKRELLEAADSIVRRMLTADAAVQRLRIDPKLRDEASFRRLQLLNRQQGELNGVLQAEEQAARPEQMKYDRDREEQRLQNKLWKARRNPHFAKRSPQSVQDEIDNLPAKFAKRIERRDALRAQAAKLSEAIRDLEEQSLA